MIANQSKVVIRDAQPGDRDAISALTLDVYQQYREVMAPAAWAGLDSAIRGALAGEPDAQRIVAEQHGTLVGSVLLCPPAAGAYGGAVARIEWPEIRLLAVAAHARGQGIGTTLLAACIDRARRDGYQSVGLHSSDSMAVAIRMYQRAGFVRNPAYDFQPPGAELVMAFRLDLDTPAMNVTLP